MPATDVRRWRQKCVVPSFAEPRPRTLLSGVRIPCRSPQKRTM